MYADALHRRQSPSRLVSLPRLLAMRWKRIGMLNRLVEALSAVELWASLRNRCSPARTALKGESLRAGEDLALPGSSACPEWGLLSVC